jgi:hypothetical protein
MASDMDTHDASPLNGDYVPPEFGALGKEISALMTDEHEPSKKASLALKPKLKIKKKARLEIRDANKEAKKQKRDQLVNKLLWKYVEKMEKKVENGGKKKKERRKITNPTEKQQRQWNNFAARVAHAKLIYAGMEKSVDNWKLAMQRAYATGDAPAISETLVQ